MPKYVVAHNEGYSPICEFFDSLEDAEKAMEEERDAAHSDDGRNEYTIVIAEIIKAKTFKSDA